MNNEYKEQAYDPDGCLWAGNIRNEDRGSLAMTLERMVEEGDNGKKRRETDWTTS